MRLLVQVGGANIQARNTENGSVPLHEACANGHKEVVRELLSLNAPVNPRNGSGLVPSQIARNNSHIDCAEILGRVVSLRVENSVIINIKIVNLFQKIINAPLQKLAPVNGTMVP